MRRRKVDVLLDNESLNSFQSEFLINWEDDDDEKRDQASVCRCAFPHSNSSVLLLLILSFPPLVFYASALGACKCDVPTVRHSLVVRSLFINIELVRSAAPCSTVPYRTAPHARPLGGAFTRSVSSSLFYSLSLEDGGYLWEGTRHDDASSFLPHAFDCFISIN